MSGQEAREMTRDELILLNNVLREERDRAREECGYEKHMRKFNAEERDRWIKKWTEHEKTCGSAPAAEFLHDEWWGLAEKGWVNYHALAAAYDDPSHARGPIEGCRAETCKFFVDARRGLIRAYPGPGEDGGDSVTGAQPRSGLRSQTPPTPLSSPDAAAENILTPCRDGDHSWCAGSPCTCSCHDVPADTIESVLAPYFETQVYLLPEAVDAVKRVASGSAPAERPEDCACEATMFDGDRIIVRGSPTICHTRVEGEKCFVVGEPKVVLAEDILSAISQERDA